jgi:hypothetical protein
MPVEGSPGSSLGGVKIPESTKSSLGQRVSGRARERWPGLSAVRVRFRSGFAYVDGQIGEEVTPLFRLRYPGSASRWGFGAVVGVMPLATVEADAGGPRTPVATRVWGNAYGRHPEPADGTRRCLTQDTPPLLSLYPGPAAAVIDVPPPSLVHMFPVGFSRGLAGAPPETSWAVPASLQGDNHPSGSVAGGRCTVVTGRPGALLK